MADLTTSQASQAVRLTDETNDSQVKLFSDTLTDSTTGLVTRSALVGKDSAGTYRNIVANPHGHTGVFFNPTDQDAFGRLRVSQSISLFGYTHAYSKGDLVWNEQLTGTASATHSNVLSSVVASVGTANGDQVIRQTKRYARYVPGKSSFATYALQPGAPKANVRKRWGSFDSDSGFFFEQTSTGIAVVLRQFLTGAAVDISVPQASWNKDRLDGTGPSGATLDQTKHNIFFIDFSWHGGGVVRFGVLLNGVTVYCHGIECSNVFNGPYSRYPSHPSRIELTNTGATASTTTVQITAVSANKEGQEAINAAYIFSASNEAVAKVVPNALRPVLSIRLNPTFQGLTNRIILEPVDFEVLTIQNSGYCQVVLNPTLTGAVWQNVNTTPTNNFSSAQKDVSATALSGGTVLFENYVPSGGKGGTTIFESANPAILSNNITGTNTDILTIAFQSFGNNTDVYGRIGFKEFQ